MIGIDAVFREDVRNDPRFLLLEDDRLDVNPELVEIFVSTLEFLVSLAHSLRRRFPLVSKLLDELAALGWRARPLSLHGLLLLTRILILFALLLGLLSNHRTTAALAFI